VTGKTGAAARPFVKWAGGKTQILDAIRERYPEGLGKHIKKYAEPFVGGGAVLFDVLNRFDITEAYISDVNRELICAYDVIRGCAAELADRLSYMEAHYLNAGEAARRIIYYTARDRYNELKLNRGNNAEPLQAGNSDHMREIKNKYAPGDGEGFSDVDYTELATLFIFLNKTCYNGLYRVNADGAFNVPQGRYKNPNICDGINLFAVSEKLKNVSIKCAGYRESRSFIDENTFVYFDPPYRPLTGTSDFTSYAEGAFGDNEQAELALFIEGMDRRGAYILASNSDPKNADGRDDFFDRLYSKFTIERINANRTINSVRASRGKISELLISNIITL